MKDTYNKMDHLSSAVNYQEHRWLICEDFPKNRKDVIGKQGLKGGHTTYPSFLYFLNSQVDDQHYVRLEWL